MPNKFTAALKSTGGAKSTSEEAGVPYDPASTDKQDKRPPVRRGAKHIGGYFDPAIAKQLKQIALDEDTTLQALLREAITDFLARRKR